MSPLPDSFPCSETNEDHQQWERLESCYTDVLSSGSQSDPRKSSNTCNMKYYSIKMYAMMMKNLFKYDYTNVTAGFQTKCKAYKTIFLVWPPNRLSLRIRKDDYSNKMALIKWHFTNDDYIWYLKQSYSNKVNVMANYSRRNRTKYNCS